MMCHEFKGGIGTSSRVLSAADGGFTVGVLVQANYGARYQLRLSGLPVGDAIGVDVVPGIKRGASQIGRPHETDQGSIIIVVATDAPLLPLQTQRLARRAGMGLAQVGSIASDGSGDLFIAFSTANKTEKHHAQDQFSAFQVTTIPHAFMTPLFEAVIEATQEAIWNAICMAQTLEGIRGRVLHALPLDKLKEIVSPDK